MSKKSSSLRAIVATSLAWVTLLSGTAVLANADTISAVRSALNVRVNGEAVAFTPATTPVVIDGQTFVPVDVLAEALGVNLFVTDATIYLGARPGVPMALVNAAPANELSRAGVVGAVHNNHNTGVRIYENTQLEGRAFSDVLTFVTFGASAGSAGIAGREWSEHILGGNYTRLTGYLGRQYGSTHNPGLFRFYADGERVAEFTLTPGAGLVHVDLDVTGVHNLRIEAGNPPNTGASTRAHGFAATLR